MSARRIADTPQYRRIVRSVSFLRGNGRAAWKTRAGIGIDVLTATRVRLAILFDAAPSVYVSFSGGKDSGVLLHLAVDEARRRDRKIGVLFIDWEAQFRRTIDYVERCMDMYRDHIEPYWVALPLRTVNATSQYEPEWTCWDPAKRDLWVRQPPARAITDPAFFPFYRHAMTFEEFVPAFERWYSAEHGPAASLVGIRTAESLNRWRSLISDKRTWRSYPWTTIGRGRVVRAYPLYDWETEDIWTYYARAGAPYNPLYDLMHQAGVTLHAMRVCEPFGDEPRRGLWMYQALEPETWAKLVARVAGANTGALYCQERGNVLGNYRITLPDGHTWRSFAHLLLESMPPSTAEHYRNKIAVYVRYCQTRWPEHYGDGLPDTQEGDLGARDVPSWRRICKVLLRNDYWCGRLSFSPTKTDGYERYRDLMRRRRQEWKLALP